MLYNGGVTRIVSSILALYIAAFAYTNASFAKAFLIAGDSDAGLFVNRLVVFLLFYIPIQILLYRNVAADPSYGARGVLKKLCLGLVCLGLVLAFLYHVIPLEPVYDLPASVDRFFASDGAFTLWLIAPLAILFI